MGSKNREISLRELIEGCRETANLCLKVEREYHPLEEEVHRTIIGQPKVRRSHEIRDRMEGE